mmetsp:Transcript_6045/g.6488  ORF Transcript_6045/g.6488 Transcript_6045/m.6488 type:complete len:203 (+) Transcript_6045:102-710(+)
MPVCSTCQVDKPNAGFTKKQAMKARAGGTGVCLLCAAGGNADASAQVGQSSTQAVASSPEAQEPVKWMTEHSEQLPEGGVFTFESLAQWNGVRLPMCLGVCGKVVDVSSSDNFKIGEGYGKLWAGRDTTFSMATVSLKAVDANRLDFKLEDFSELQVKSLAGWYKHFTSKYKVVGTLKEYNDWDFSSIETLAAELPAPTFGK